MKRRAQDHRAQDHGARDHRAEEHGKRSQLSALMPVVALLTAATLAKFAAATQFFHLSH
jgi:hypothetical protein